MQLYLQNNSIFCKLSDTIFMTIMYTETKMVKKAAVINDLSGFGKCSLTASIAVLSVMGIQPCPVPTAILTNQTGYENYYSCDFSKHMHNYTDIWKQNDVSFDGIYSGYVSSAQQTDIISDFISTFKKSYTQVLVDPVMADDGKIYAAYNSTTCKKMCELIKKADIITPNLTELCIISGQDYGELVKKSDDKNYLEIIANLAKKTVSEICPSVIVTGIKKDSFIYNGVFTANENFFVKSKQYGDSFSGTGDIFASVICGCILNGINIKTAVNIAAEFLEKAILDTIKTDYDKNDGVNFEKYLYTLANKGGRHEQ